MSLNLVYPGVAIGRLDVFSCQSSQLFLVRIKKETVLQIVKLSLQISRGNFCFGDEIRAREKKTEQWVLVRTKGPSLGQGERPDAPI